MRALYTFVVVSAAFSGLAACNEEPQVLDTAQAPGYASDAWPDQLRERTLRQNESGRIY